MGPLPSTTNAPDVEGTKLGPAAPLPRRSARVPGTTQTARSLRAVTGPAERGLEYQTRCLSRHRIPKLVWRQWNTAIVPERHGTAVVDAGLPRLLRRRRQSMDWA